MGALAAVAQLRRERSGSGGYLPAVRTVLFSSPGGGPGPHWSHACARGLARPLLAAGHELHWFPVAGARDEVPAPPPGLATFAARLCRRQPLHRVGAGCGDLPTEALLARDLRDHPDTAVVVCGTGARGSPNLPWLAERMGSPAFAVVRAAEVLCARGDLVDAAGAACTTTDEPARCRRCVGSGPWRRPALAELQNRREQLVAGLQACRAVFVSAVGEATSLELAGVPRRVLQVAPPEDLPAALGAALAAARRPS